MRRPDTLLLPLRFWELREKFHAFELTSEELEEFADLLDSNRACDLLLRLETTAQESPLWAVLNPALSPTPSNVRLETPSGRPSLLTQLASQWRLSNPVVASAVVLCVALGMSFLLLPQRDSTSPQTTRIVTEAVNHGIDLDLPSNEGQEEGGSTTNYGQSRTAGSLDHFKESVKSGSSSPTADDKEGRPAGGGHGLDGDKRRMSGFAMDRAPRPPSLIDPIADPAEDPKGDLALLLVVATDESNVSRPSDLMDALEEEAESSDHFGESHNWGVEVGPSAVDSASLPALRALIDKQRMPDQRPAFLLILFAPRDWTVAAPGVIVEQAILLHLTWDEGTLTGAALKVLPSMPQTLETPVQSLAEALMADAETIGLPALREAVESER